MVPRSNHLSHTAAKRADERKPKTENANSKVYGAFSSDFYIILQYSKCSMPGNTMIGSHGVYMDTFTLHINLLQRSSSIHHKRVFNLVGFSSFHLVCVAGCERMKIHTNDIHILDILAEPIATNVY